MRISSVLVAVGALGLTPLAAAAPTFAKEFLGGLDLHLCAFTKAGCSPFPKAVDALDEQTQENVIPVSEQPDTTTEGGLQKRRHGGIPDLGILPCLWHGDCVGEPTEEDAAPDADGEIPTETVAEEGLKERDWPWPFGEVKSCATASIWYFDLICACPKGWYNDGFTCYDDSQEKRDSKQQEQPQAEKDNKVTEDVPDGLFDVDYSGPNFKDDCPGCVFVDKAVKHEARSEKDEPLEKADAEQEESLHAEPPVKSMEFSDQVMAICGDNLELCSTEKTSEHDARSDNGELRDGERPKKRSPEHPQAEQSADKNDGSDISDGFGIDRPILPWWTFPDLCKYGDCSPHHSNIVEDKARPDDSESPNKSGASEQNQQQQDSAQVEEFKKMISDIPIIDTIDEVIIPIPMDLSPDVQNMAEDRARFYDGISPDKVNQAQHNQPRSEATAAEAKPEKQSGKTNDDFRLADLVIGSIGPPSDFDFDPTAVPLDIKGHRKISDLEDIRTRLDTGMIPKKDDHKQQEQPQSKGALATEGKSEKFHLSPKAMERIGKLIEGITLIEDIIVPADDILDQYKDIVAEAGKWIQLIPLDIADHSYHSSPSSEIPPLKRDLVEHIVGTKTTEYYGSYPRNAAYTSPSHPHHALKAAGDADPPRYLGEDRISSRAEPQGEGSDTTNYNIDVTPRRGGPIVPHTTGPIGPHVPGDLDLTDSTSDIHHHRKISDTEDVRTRLDTGTSAPKADQRHPHHNPQPEYDPYAPRYYGEDRIATSSPKTQPVQKEKRGLFWDPIRDWLNRPAYDEPDFIEDKPFFDKDAKFIDPSKKVWDWEEFWGGDGGGGGMCTELYCGD